MRRWLATLFTALVVVAALAAADGTQDRIVTEADCTTPSLVTTIAPAAIGEPVRSVALQAAWVAATDTVPAHCRVDGVFAPVDTAPTARVINCRRSAAAAGRHPRRPIRSGRSTTKRSATSATRR
jgi:hypothetical protein